MSGPFGFVLPAAVVGLGPLLLKPKQRGFFPFNDDGEALSPIIAQATVEEQHSDELRITEHPVEEGAAIADHAYKMPAEVTIRGIWSNSPTAPSGIVGQAVAAGAALSANVAVGVAASLPQTISAVQSILTSSGGIDAVSSIYARLLALQISRTPFDVYTGKRVYRDMLMQTIAVDTSAKSENSLVATIRCKQVLIVRTQVVTLQAAAQKDPQATAAVVDRGAQNLVLSPVQIDAP